MNTPIARTQILPPATVELRLPAGTPLGLGILGSAKFAAMRRVLEHACRAAEAKANLHHSEAAVARALVGREIAREQLRNVDLLCEEEASRINDGVKIAQLRRKLELMELEDRVAEREAQRPKSEDAAPSSAATAGGVAPDEFQSFIADLQRIPDIAKAVSEVKEKIVANAGGEAELSDADKATCDMLDAMMQAFVSKKAGDTAL